MKYTINTSDVYNRGGRRSARISNTARVFVESNATKLIDEWFRSNGVYALKFKCKTWGKLGRLAHKVNRIAISEALAADPKNVRFSHYCGCSCPCSPGYNVNNSPYNGKGVWMDIEATEEELKPLTDYLKIAGLELQVEIAEHENK